MENGKRRRSKQSVSLRNRLRMSQLELLAAMGDAVTLTAAARLINLTQPAASRLLNTLEADLGIALFERDGRSLTPTSAGQRLIRKAMEMMAELDVIQEDLEALETGLSGHVRVGSSVSASYTLLPKSLEILHKEAPGVSISLRESSMDELVRFLREGRLDLLIGRFENATTLDDIIVERLHAPIARIVCHPTHPLLQEPSVTWSRLVEYGWILPETGTPMRQAVEAVFRTQNTRPISWIESSVIPTNVSLLAKFDMVWVLSADVADYFADLGALAVVPEIAIESPGSFTLAHLRHRHLSAAAQRLRESLLEVGCGRPG